MKNELRQIDRAADQIMMAIEDQIARPILWVAGEVARRQTQRVAPLGDVSEQGNPSEWDDEKKNPLEHWRWA